MPPAMTDTPCETLLRIRRTIPSNSIIIHIHCKSPSVSISHLVSHLDVLELNCLHLTGVYRVPSWTRPRSRHSQQHHDQIHQRYPRPPLSALISQSQIRYGKSLPHSKQNQEIKDIRDARD